MDYSITFAPLIPIIGLVVLTTIFAIAILFGALKRMKGFAWRTIAGAVLLLALFGPQINQEERSSLSNIVFIVSDNSESQKVSDRPAQIAKGLNALRSKLGSLANFETREVIVENNANEGDSGSLVLGALAKASAEVAQSRIAGAIILTDGRIHDETVLSEFPAPVHVLQTGHSSDWDKRLVLINAPSFAIVDEEIILKLRIDEQGNVPVNVMGNAELSIAIDGETYGVFPLPTNRELELPIKLKHAGINVIQFNVTPEDGELTERNNAAVLSINGVRDRLRVLLVSGEPHTGERTWRNLLKSDSAVDLVHFTILRPPEKQDGVPVSELSLIAFPVRQLFLDKIDEFDLIIFDRYKRRGMLTGRYLQNVVNYVENGGAVLVATGESFAGAESLYRTDLAQILPARPTTRVIERGYYPRISTLGERHPVTESLEKHSPVIETDKDVPNWGRWLRLVEADVTSGAVIMTGAEDKPLLVLDRVGDGRVAMLLSDHAWLWSRGYEGGGPQLEMLRRLAHWMMKEPDLEEERLSARQDNGNVVITRRSIKNDPRNLIVKKPDGSDFQLEMIETAPGKWSAEFEGEENGLYRLSDGSEETVVALGPVLPREFEQTIADAELLRPLIDATKGTILELEQTPSPDVRVVRSGRVAAGKSWIGVVDRQAYVTTSVRQTPLLPAWAYLLFAAGLAVLAWWIEGRRTV